MFPIANDAGKIIAFTGRTLATDEIWAKVFEFCPRPESIPEGACSFDLAPRASSDPQAGSRDPGRGTDGLHFRVRRRISQRDRQLARHSLSLAIETLVSRATSSSGSPRNIRATTAILR